MSTLTAGGGVGPAAAPDPAAGAADEAEVDALASEGEADGHADRPRPQQRSHYVRALDEQHDRAHAGNGCKDSPFEGDQSDHLDAGGLAIPVDLDQRIPV